MNYKFRKIKSECKYFDNDGNEVTGLTMEQKFSRTVYDGTLYMSEIFHFSPMFELKRIKELENIEYDGYDNFLRIN